jgi:hypothetical protein
MLTLHSFHVTDFMGTRPNTLRFLKYDTSEYHLLINHFYMLYEMFIDTLFYIWVVVGHKTGSGI